MYHHGRGLSVQSDRGGGWSRVPGKRPPCLHSRAEPARPWRLWGGCGQRAPARRGRRGSVPQRADPEYAGHPPAGQDQSPQHGGGIPNAVVCQNDPQFAAVHLGGYLHLHRVRGCAGRRCSAGFPAPGPAMRGRHPALPVPLHRSGPDSRCSCRPGAYHKKSATARQQRPGGQLWRRRLGAVLQLAGQVQVVDQRADALALGADTRSLTPGRIRQGQSPAPAVRPSPGSERAGCGCRG